MIVGVSCFYSRWLLVCVSELCLVYCGAAERPPGCRASPPAFPWHSSRPAHQALLCLCPSALVPWLCLSACLFYGSLRWKSTFDCVGSVTCLLFIGFVLLTSSRFFYAVRYILIWKASFLRYFLEVNTFSSKNHCYRCLPVNWREPLLCRGGCFPPGCVQGSLLAV